MLLQVLMLASLFQTAVPQLKTIDGGPNSAATTARQVVVRSSPEWETLWRSVSTNRPLPAMDFAKNMVVGVFLGQRPTAGYGVQIVRTRDEKGALVVEYRETKPAPGTMSAQVLTAPYQLVALSMFAGDVRFEKVE